MGRSRIWKTPSESVRSLLTWGRPFVTRVSEFMKERRWGRIINVSSQAAYTGSSNHAHYAAAKAGLLGFTFSLAKELGAWAITANVVSPGRIVTDMLTDKMAGLEEEWIRQTPLRRFGRPEEVPGTIAFLTSEEASYITGTVLNVSGGLVMG